MILKKEMTKIILKILINFFCENVDKFTVFDIMFYNFVIIFFPYYYLLKNRTVCSKYYWRNTKSRAN